MNKPEQKPACLNCAFTDVVLWGQGCDVEYRSTTETFQYFRCPNCAVLFIDPVPSERLAEIYPENYYSYDSAAKTGLLTKGILSIKTWLDSGFFVSTLRTIPGDEIKALDIGGGAGEQLDLIRANDRRIKQTDIVDISPQAEKLARAKGHRYFLTRIEDFVPDTNYDLVIMLNLIEHVLSPQKVLKIVRRHLTPRGRVIIKTPNYDSLDAKLFRDGLWGGYHCPRHWVIFDKDAIERIVNQCGFKIDRFHYTQGAPFWAVSTLATLERLKAFERPLGSALVEQPLFYPLCSVFAGFDMVRGLFFKTSQMFVVLQCAEQ